MRNGLLLQEAMAVYTIGRLIKDESLPEPKGKSWQGPHDNGGKKASWSIWRDKAGQEKATDHREGKTYDVVSLLALVKGVSNREACRIVIDRAGVKPLDDGPPQSRPNKRKAPAAPKVAATATGADKPPIPPPFDSKSLMPRALNADEIEAIATTRGVSSRTVEHVASFGVMHAVTLTAWLKLPIPRQSLPMPAWALHSPDWRSFRLRAFVGIFPGFNNGQEHKSLTPAGGSCAWPVWVGPPSARRVLLVEGEGDAAGAWEIARRERAQDGLAVLVMFSSSLSVPTSFLPNLEGKRVRIVPHCGDSRRQGEVAAVKWAAAIRPWAADVQIFSLAGLAMPDGREVGDLGDLAQCPDETLSRCGGVASW